MQKNNKTQNLIVSSKANYNSIFYFFGFWYSIKEMLESSFPCGTVLRKWKNWICYTAILRFLCCQFVIIFFERACFLAPVGMLLDRLYRVAAFYCFCTCCWAERVWFMYFGVNTCILHGCRKPTGNCTRLNGCWFFVVMVQICEKKRVVSR